MFKLLILTAFLNCIAWISLIPLWHYPDEQAHFGQIQYMSLYGYKLTPAQEPNTSYEVSISEKILDTQRDGFSNNKFTYHPTYNIKYSDTNYGFFEKYIMDLDSSNQSDLVKYEATSNPPLYYLIGAQIHSALSNNNLFNRVYAIRTMSALIFMLTIVTSFKISKLIFNDNKKLIHVLSSLVAFMPMLVFSSTGVLPDTLTNLLFSVIILFSIKILSKGVKFIYLISSLASIVFGFITRQQFTIALPILLVAIFWRISSDAKHLKILILSSLFVAISLYYLSNHPIPIPVLSEIRIVDFNIYKSGKVGIQPTLEYVKFNLSTYYNQTLPWYWGIYRWLSLSLPLNYYRSIKIIMLISVIGLAIWVYKTIKLKTITGNRNIFFLIFSSLIYLSAFLIGDYFFFISHNFSFGIQGRYFFPMIIAHFCIALVGINEAIKVISVKLIRPTLIALITFMIIFNDLSLFHVASSYYSTSSISVFLTQASQYKPEVFKGANLVIILMLTAFAQLMYIIKLVKSMKQSYI